MRGIAFALGLGLLVCHTAFANEYSYPSELAIDRLSSSYRATSISVGYDSESLTSILSMNVGPAKIRFSVINPLNLPMYEPMGGVDISETTLLSEELSGLDVDFDSDPGVRLALFFYW